MHVERTAFSLGILYIVVGVLFFVFRRQLVALAAKFPPKRYRVKTRKGCIRLAIFCVLLGLISLAIGVFGNG